MSITGLEAAAFFKTDASTKWPDFQLHINSFSPPADSRAGIEKYNLKPEVWYYICTYIMQIDLFFLSLIIFPWNKIFNLELGK